jgi:type IV pilus assembly protein PilC
MMNLIVRVIELFFWTVAAIVVMILLSLLFSLVFFALAPVAAFFTLIIVAALVRRMRQRRAMCVLGYLEQALRLNLPLPGMLAAARQSERGATRYRLGQLGSAIEAGAPLAESLDVHVPKIHPADISLIQAAEHMGRLPQIVGHLLARKRIALRNRPHEQTVGWVYGMTIVFCLLLILGAVSVYILPQCRAIFADFGATMPWPTMVTFEVTQAMGGMVFAVISLLILLLAGGNLMIIIPLIRSRRPVGPGLLDPLLWVTPIIGTMVKNRGLCRGCEVIAEALRSGSTMPAALIGAGDLWINSVLRNRFDRFADAVLEGQSVHDAAGAAHMPAMMTGMLATADSGGDVVAGFQFLGKYYGSRFSRTAEVLRATTLPLIVMFLALIVGWVVVSLFLPMVTLINHTNTYAMGAM